MLSLEELLKEVSKDGRIYPRPQQWNKLYELLPNRQRKRAGWEPPVPLILGAWWHTTNEEKRERFYDHIHWAAKNGSLDLIADFIYSLNEEDWYIGD